MEKAIAENLQHLVLTLMGLGGVTWAVIWVIRQFRGTSTDDPHLTKRNGCVTETDLWGKHIPRWKEQHDELCGHKLKPMRDDLKDIKEAVRAIGQIKGTVDTILQLTKEQNGKGRKGS